MHLELISNPTERIGPIKTEASGSPSLVGLLGSLMCPACDVTALGRGRQQYLRARDSPYDKLL